MRYVRRSWEYDVANGNLDSTPRIAEMNLPGDRDCASHPYPYQDRVAEPVRGRGPGDWGLLYSWTSSGMLSCSASAMALCRLE